MYHPLNNSVLTPTIGSAFELTETSPTKTTEEGIKCMLFNSGGLKQINQSYWTQNSPMTLSIWGKCLDNANAAALATGTWSSKQAFELMKQNYWKLVWHGAETTASNVNRNYWNHICGIYNGSKFIFYINGEKIGEANISNLNIPNQIAIGGNFNGTNIPRDSWFYGYLAAARVYNRALDESEIQELANEFSVLYPITVNNLSL